MDLNTLILNVWSSVSPDDGYCEVTIPVGRGPRDVTLEVAHETALASSTIFVF